MFNLNKVVSHYMSVCNKLRDNIIDQDQLQEIVERDCQNYIQLKNKSLITEQEFQSILNIVNEFEDIFEEIIKSQTNDE